MKFSVDTVLLILIAALLIVLCGISGCKPPRATVQAESFTWDEINRQHEDSTGRTWHTVVKFCTINYGAPDRFSQPYRVYSPADAVQELAFDGWQLVWSDGKTWIVQRIGDPKQWRYSNFMVVPQAD